MAQEITPTVTQQADGREVSMGELIKGLETPKGEDLRAVVKRLLDVREAACYLGISPRTIYNGIGPRAEKPFPVKPKRWGRKILFDKADLDAHVDSMTVDTLSTDGA
jgi:predicted DNA-binding transcriptional regulator AlpA